MTEFQNKSDKEEYKSDVTEEQKDMLGAVLKEAREAKNYTTAEVATRLHLRNAVVTEIEQDDFSNISSATYVRGYVRNYARLVEADNALIEECLLRQVPTTTSPHMQSFSRKTSIDKRDTRWMWLTYLIVLVSIALAVWWWFQKPTSISEIISKPSIEELQTPAAEPNSAADPDKIIEPEKSATDTSEQPNHGTISDNTLTDTDAGTTTATTDAESTETASAAIAANSPSATAESTAESTTEQPSLTARADAASERMTQAVSAGAVELVLSGDCWIKATDATGEVLIDGLKNAGRRIQVAGTPPISVILGAPESVTMKYNDANVSLDGYKAGRVARLTLPQA